MTTTTSMAKAKANAAKASIPGKAAASSDHDSVNPGSRHHDSPETPGKDTLDEATLDEATLDEAKDTTAGHLAKDTDDPTTQNNRTTATPT